MNAIDRSSTGSNEPITVSDSRCFQDEAGSQAQIDPNIRYVDLNGSDSAPVHPDVRLVSAVIADHEANPDRAHLLAAARQRLATRDANGETSLRGLRLAAGLSQDRLAQLIGSSQPRIARLEAGREDPSMTVARRLAKALGVDMNTLSSALERAGQP
jgi:DNA-binding XRE family transcriptional regulator